MPQINEYLPETEGASPVGPISPNLEASSIYGRGIENLGSTVQQAGDLVYRRDEQKEVSQTYAKVAQARVDWNTKLHQQINDGSLDVDQFKQDFQDNMDQIGGQLETAGGKDFFNRQAARLGGVLLQQASVGQAQVAGAQAKQDATTAINGLSTSLMQNPAAFDDVHGSFQEYLDAQVKSGAIKPQALDQVKQFGEGQLVKGALMGWAKNDPGDAELGQEGMAKKMLDQGAFDQFLDASSKQQMYQMADTAAKAASTKRHQQDKLADNQYSDMYEQVGNKWLGQIQKDQLSPSTVLNSQLQEKDKEHFLAQIQSHAKGEDVTDPRVYNQVSQDIANGKITDMNTLMPRVGKDISTKDIEKLSGLMKVVNQSPSSTVNQQNALLKAGYESLRYKDPMTQTWSPQGEINYKKFHDGLLQKVQDAQNNGQPVGQIFDPKAPGNYWDELRKYPAGLNATIQGATDSGHQKVLPQLYPPAPGVSANPAPKLPDNARKSGESIPDYKKRMGF